jgi:hypothetical protein
MKVEKADKSEVPEAPASEGLAPSGSNEDVYQTPTLVLLGNVHTILAGSGPSPHGDGQRFSTSKP